MITIYTSHGALKSVAVSLRYLFKSLQSTADAVTILV